ncbi:MAG: methyltransferase [Candidatus Diapherotrites archaeon]|nr:methyltransferase [Candidatus Diapherotrites archaeon]
MAEHYFSEKPSSEEKRTTYAFELRGRTYELASTSGTFSWKKLDSGTKALLKYMRVPNGRICDLGCGNGVVGVVAGVESGSEVWLVDVNERAVRTAKRNAVKYGLKFKAKTGDGLKALDTAFDCVLLNPPMAAGLRTVRRLIEEAFAHLKEGGSLQVVARHKKGGERLMQFMEELFGNIETIGRQGGFHVYCSVKH